MKESNEGSSKNKSLICIIQTDYLETSSIRKLFVKMYLEIQHCIIFQRAVLGHEQQQNPWQHSESFQITITFYRFLKKGCTYICTYIYVSVYFHIYIHTCSLFSTTLTCNAFSKQGIGFISLSPFSELKFRTLPPFLELNIRVQPNENPVSPFRQENK